MKTWQIVTTTAGTLTVTGINFSEAVKDLGYIGNVIGIKTI